MPKNTPYPKESKAEFKKRQAKQKSGKGNPFAKAVKAK